MRRRFRVTAWLVGIAMLAMTLEAGGTARAGSTAAKGIQITGGGIQQLGDPFYIYTVEVYLEPGYQIDPGDSFTLEKLAGVQYSTTPGLGSSTISPGGDPSGPWAPIITNLAPGPLPNYSPTTIVSMANVEFKDDGPAIVNSGGSAEFLGQFEVYTPFLVPLPELPASYSVIVGWSATLQGVTENGVVTLSVPEPASVILLGVGVSLSILWQIRRRRRASPAPQV